MKAPQERNWERVLARYFTAHGIPLKWNGVSKRFTGWRGLTVARINPGTASIDNQWKLMPQNLRKIEETALGNAIILVTNKRYGDSVDDTIVVTRLGTFIDLVRPDQKGT